MATTPRSKTKARKKEQEKPFAGPVAEPQDRRVIPGPPPDPPKDTVSLKWGGWGDRIRHVSIDERSPIIEEMTRHYRGDGEIEDIKARLDQQDRVISAILHGCSKKNWRQTVQAFGLEINK